MRPSVPFCSNATVQPYLPIIGCQTCDDKTKPFPRAAILLTKAALAQPQDVGLGGGLKITPPLGTGWKKEQESIRTWIEKLYEEPLFKTEQADKTENINEIELPLCKKTGCNHAVALTSGTSALHMAVKLAGIKPGDRVFCTDMTFAATVNPVNQGGIPVPDYTEKNVSTRIVKIIQGHTTMW